MIPYRKKKISVGGVRQCLAEEWRRRINFPLSSGGILGELGGGRLWL